VAAAAAEPADETPAPEEAEAAPAPTPPPAEKQTEDLMATGVISARPDIAAMEEAAKAAPEQLAPTTAEGEGPRLLVVAPDVPEQVYPFTGEVMSMGRGRNNDIQIKNDGKISRYHCRIFRRGDEFIIEDNKSSNGTLVNGKLVTRQRLDGGEQVQIGETRMTFFL
jgi:pSer/pThr/pTyr-binding forkhead associated (FHA) protein